MKLKTSCFLPIEVKNNIHLSNSSGFSSFCYCRKGAELLEVVSWGQRTGNIRGGRLTMGPSER